MIRSVSDITSDSTVDVSDSASDSSINASSDDAQGIMYRPKKIRRVDPSIHSQSSKVMDTNDLDTNMGNEDFLNGRFSDNHSSDDEFTDDDSGDDNDGELDEESILKMKHKDPTFMTLVMRRISEGANGMKAGSCIGDSARLKKFSIEGESINWKGDPKTYDWFMQFFTGLARNRSIDYLAFRDCNLDDEAAVTTFARLTPFFELNSSLYSLEMSSCNVGDEITRLLASALSKRCNKSSLHRINLDANLIGDEAGKELVDALKGYDNLSELSLGDNEIGRKGCIALGNLLSHPSGNLKDLNLENNRIDDDCISSVTNNLASNKKTSLKELSLSFNCNITQAGWQMLSTCLQNQDSALEKLDISSTDVTDEGVIALGSSLIKNKTLKALDLYDLSSDGRPLISGIGWQGFFVCLQNQESALERIDLRYSSIDEGGLTALTNALANNSTLKMLDLSHNKSISARQWRPFFACLGYPNVELEELCLCDNNVTDEELAYLAQSLAKNRTLKALDLGATSSITNTGWAPFSRLLCDKSSISSIHASNHTLEFLGDQRIPVDLDDLLQLNEQRNKMIVSREKILKYHFQNSENNVQEFIDVESKVLPHAINVISQICSNGAGRTLLFELLRTFSVKNGILLHVAHQYY